MILFEGASLLGGPVRPHGLHIPKSTTGWGCLFVGIIEALVIQ